MKAAICTICGMSAGIAATLFGGWNSALTTLLIFMLLDYVSGLLVAGIFGRSTKTRSGKLESKAGFKGLCRKFMILFYVLIAVRLDLLLHTNCMRDAVAAGFIVNELLSIVENAGLMGVPLPRILMNAVDVLSSKSGQMK